MDGAPADAPPLLEPPVTAVVLPPVPVLPPVFEPPVPPAALPPVLEPPVPTLPPVVPVEPLVPPVAGVSFESELHAVSERRSPPRVPRLRVLRIVPI
jgi:hypothetical protein